MREQAFLPLQSWEYRGEMCEDRGNVWKPENSRARITPLRLHAAGGWIQRLKNFFQPLELILLILGVQRAVENSFSAVVFSSGWIGFQPVEKQPLFHPVENLFNRSKEQLVLMSQNKSPFRFFRYMNSYVSRTTSVFPDEYPRQARQYPPQVHHQSSSRRWLLHRDSTCRSTQEVGSRT